MDHVCCTFFARLKVKAGKTVMLKKKKKISTVFVCLVGFVFNLKSKKWVPQRLHCGKFLLFILQFGSISEVYSHTSLQIWNLWVTLVTTFGKEIFCHPSKRHANNSIGQRSLKYVEVKNVIYKTKTLACWEGQATLDMGWSFLVQQLLTTRWGLDTEPSSLFDL